MGAARSIRTDIPAEELRRLARQESNGQVACRLLAVANALAGMSREDAARQAGMDRQTLHDWVIRFNAEGVEGLRDRPKSGRPSWLDDGQLATLKALVLRGPDPERDGVTTWRAKDLCRLVEDRFGVSYTESGMLRLLHDLGLSWKARPVFGGTEAGPLAGIVKVVPIERLSSILVVSSQPAYLDQAATWIERLDRTSEGEEPRLYVYPVQNARATNLAEVLGGIFGAQAATVGASLLAPGREAMQLQSSQGFELGATQTQETPPGQETAERVLPTRPAAPAVSAPLSPTSVAFGPEEEGQPEIRIIADDSTNSLVIRALPADYRKIRDAIEKLDSLPLQVLLEATIAEVTLSNQLRYGVEWFFRSGDFEATLSQRDTGAVVGTFPGFSALFSNADARVLLTALEQISDVNVISSPQLLVLDNQTARLQVGDQVPITVQQATPITGGVDTIVNSIELHDTGVILTVTPRVNAGGLVIMEIQQEVSNVVRAETVTQSELTTPTISQRLVTSTVVVQSGQTVALGGLITDNQDRSRTGVPILSSIPIIGTLFSTRNRTHARTELLVLITPRVIDSPQRAEAVTEELRRRLSGVAPRTVP